MSDDKLVERIESAITLELTRQSVTGFSLNGINPRRLARAAIEAMPERASMEGEIEALRARIGAAINVIESGYRGVNKAEKCPHDRYGFEDCIACYDEQLLAALTSSKTGDER